MKDSLPAFLQTLHEPLPDIGHTRPGAPVLDRAVERIGSVIGATFMQWELASKNGLLQAMDARVKLVCLLFLLVVGTVKNAGAPGWRSPASFSCSSAFPGSTRSISTAA